MPMTFSRFDPHSAARPNLLDRLTVSLKTTTSLDDEQELRTRMAVPRRPCGRPKLHAIDGSLLDVR